MKLVSLFSRMPSLTLFIPWKIPPTSVWVFYAKKHTSHIQCEKLVFKMVSSLQFQWKRERQREVHRRLFRKCLSSQQTHLWEETSYECFQMPTVRRPFVLSTNVEQNDPQQANSEWPTRDKSHPKNDDFRNNPLAVRKRESNSIICDVWNDGW